MEQNGLGVVIGMFGGNEETVEAIEGAIGKTIQGLQMVNDELRFTFVDGPGLQLYDNGQSCGEKRYMRTDDDLSYFLGSILQGVEVRDAPGTENARVVHEVQFLLVTTSKGVFTMATHNEHNGYYGGFLIVAKTL